MSSRSSASAWRYYKGAFIPSCAPHEEQDLAELSDGSLWARKEKGLFARYTENFDKSEKGSFWYVICDSFPELSQMKAKRRYEITRAQRFFETKVIDCLEYREELLQVQKEAFSAYPKKYRPRVERESFFAYLDRISAEGYTVIASFSKDDGHLCGFSLIKDHGSYADFSVQRTIPAEEKKGVNAALVWAVLSCFEDRLHGGYYILDGSRSISHESAFQDYLEKYFGFRKAYCDLRIVYRPRVGLVVKILYPFRGLLRLFDGIGAVHSVNSLLMMEALGRGKEK